MNMAKLLSVGEHAHYPFKSYPHTQCETIMFPGCAFPSQFPRTMDALAQRCREVGFGVAYDCCGYPVDSYGEEKSAQRIVRNLRQRLKARGCKRIIVLCPSCYKYLLDKLDIEVVYLFDILDELGINHDVDFGKGSLYVPCRAKSETHIEASLRAHGNLDGITTLAKTGCCGLRADLASEGSEVVTKLSNKIINSAQAEGDTLYSYCASCLGQFSRLGYNSCRHAASVLLGVDEEPDSRHALLNRAKRKFDRNTDPL